MGAPLSRALEPPFVVHVSVIAAWYVHTYIRTQVAAIHHPSSKRVKFQIAFLGPHGGFVVSTVCGISFQPPFLMTLLPKPAFSPLRPNYRFRHAVPTSAQCPSRDAKIRCCGHTHEFLGLDGNYRAIKIWVRSKVKINMLWSYP